jgi:rfaE bifunctional protein nucleotidyltransferase chain/domain
MDPSTKIVSRPTLVAILDQRREEGRRIVLTNGCFDLLHVGHVRYLTRARALGDLLVVGLNSDASTRAIKGPKRPILPEHERAEVLAALAAVDYVTIFDEPTAEALVRQTRPDVYVKGAGYREEDLPEARVVRSYGGEVVLVPDVAGRSTSSLVATVLERYGRPSPSP